MEKELHCLYPSLALQLETQDHHFKHRETQLPGADPESRRSVWCRFANQMHHLTGSFYLHKATPHDAQAENGSLCLSTHKLDKSLQNSLEAMLLSEVGGEEGWTLCKGCCCMNFTLARLGYGKASKPAERGEC